MATSDEDVDVLDKVEAETVETGGKDEAGDGKTGADEKSTTDADKGAVDEAEAKAAALPDNWRELAADGDEDTLKLLKRYGSFKGVAKALREKDTFIRSGKMKQAMPDPSDAKAMAEWRKAEGIPDDPTGYKLPETVTKRMSDDDKPLIAGFTEYAHKKGATPAVVEIATEWYFDTVEAMEAKRIADDKEASEAAEESLRQSWGNAEFKGNLKLGGRYIETIPGVGKDFAEFRGPDGKRLGDNPEFMEWASDMGRQTFGDATFASGDDTARHTNRKAEIEKFMRTNNAEYWKDTAMQAEYADILAKEAKRK